MGQIQSLDELYSFLRRRFSVIAVLTLVGMALSLLLALSQPRLFEASTSLQVELPSIGKSSPDQSGRDAAQMLQSIQQVLTTRTALLELIERHGLFKGIAGLSQDRQVTLLRESIEFLPVTSDTAQTFGAPAAISMLVITVQWEDAEMSARIANDLAQSLLDFSATGSRARAKETEEFFLAESALVAEEIARADAELAAFRTENADFLPEISVARRDELITLETDLRQAENEVATLEGRGKTLRAGGTQRATDKRQLADVEAAMEIAIAQREQINSRRQELLSALAKAPEVEQELVAIERRLDQLQEKYDATRQQFFNAQTELQLNKSNGTERFSLLERATTPQDSIGRSRRKAAIAGTIASLAAAVALLYAFEQVFPVVRTAEQLERQLSIRPIVSIPDMPARPEAAKGRARWDNLGIRHYVGLSALATLALLVLATLLS